MNKMLSPCKFCIRATGRFAMFTTPESKTSGERFSYPYPYYEQLKGLVSGVFWKPEMLIIIDRVRIMAPVEYQSMSINEMDFGRNGKPDSAQPTIQTYLYNVDYIIEFHIEENESEYANNRRKKRGEPWCQAKYEKMMEKHIQGHSRRNPYFGKTECQAIIRPWESFFDGEGYYDNSSADMGMVYHGMDYPEQYGRGVPFTPDGVIRRRYAHLALDHGVINYPTPDKCDISTVVLNGGYGRCC